MPPNTSSNLTRAGWLVTPLKRRSDGSAKQHNWPATSSQFGLPFYYAAPYSDRGCAGDAVAPLRDRFPQELAAFDSELVNHYNANSLDAEDFWFRLELRRNLETICRKVFGRKNPDAISLHIVGSTLSGCGTRDADMDLMLVMPNMRNGMCGTIKSFVVSDLVRLEDALENATTGCVFMEVDVIRRAVVPILKLKATRGGRTIQADISVNQFCSIDNTHLLRHFASIDRRFPALCVIVKHWAKAKGINSSRCHTFTSYALNLLVLHYLMFASDPPVLPNLPQLYPEFFSATEPGLFVYKDEVLPEPLPERPLNSKSVGELLLGFFDYYAHFDFEEYVISIPQGCCVYRALPADFFRTPIKIIDPYQERNPARHVNAETFPLIVDAFRSTRNALFLHEGGPLFDTLRLGTVGELVGTVAVAEEADEADGGWPSDEGGVEDAFALTPKDGAEDSMDSEDARESEDNGANDTRLVCNLDRMDLNDSEWLTHRAVGESLAVA